MIGIDPCFEGAAHGRENFGLSACVVGSGLVGRIALGAEE